MGDSGFGRAELARPAPDVERNGGGPPLGDLPPGRRGHRSAPFRCVVRIGLAQRRRNAKAAKKFLRGCGRWPTPRTAPAAASNSDCAAWSKPHRSWAGGALPMCIRLVPRGDHEILCKGTLR